MHFLILDNVHPVLAEMLTAAGHTCNDTYGHSAARLAEDLPQAHGLVVRSRSLTRELLEQAPHLRVIGRAGSGLENIDREWCTAHNVAVFNSPEGNRDGVGEMCLLLLLGLLKHLARVHVEVRQGQWLREPNRGHELHGRVVGIIGYGQMGSAFAEKLAGMGVEVRVFDKYRSGFGGGHVQECSLEEVMITSDVISLHLPLTPETHHYANTAFFARLGRPIHFLNTARGPLVDTAALLQALDNGQVLGAGLDVLEFERPDLSGLDPGARPEALERILTDQRVLITPHIAGVTHEGRYKMAEVLARKILAAFPHAHA